MDGINFQLMSSPPLPALPPFHPPSPNPPASPRPKGCALPLPGDFLQRWGPGKPCLLFPAPCLQVQP